MRMGQAWTDQATDGNPRAGEAGWRWYGFIGLAAAVALTAATWGSRRRRRSDRIVADEARMEPRPVVY